MDQNLKVEGWAAMIAMLAAIVSIALIIVSIFLEAHHVVSESTAQNLEFYSGGILLAAFFICGLLAETIPSTNQ